jgi:hypothetical protein
MQLATGPSRECVRECCPIRPFKFFGGWQRHIVAWDIPEDCADDDRLIGGRTGDHPEASRREGAKILSVELTVKSCRGSRLGRRFVVALKFNFEGPQQALGSIVAIIVKGDCQRYQMIVWFGILQYAPFVRASRTTSGSA